jgi:hypothetical protein
MLHRLNRIQNDFYVRVRHWVFSKILKKFVFGSDGFEKNLFGSIISPLEMRLAWAPELETRALTIRSFFREVLKNNSNDVKLQRVGSDFDGGYFLPENYLEIDGVISAGIGDDNNFEFVLASLGKKVLQFDPTISAPPLSHPNMRFVSKYVNKSNNLNECFNFYSSMFNYSLENALLKIDIEGSEWELFNNPEETPNKLDFLPRVHTLVIEFHGISQIQEDDKWEDIKYSLTTILTNFEPVALSGNNCRAFFQLGGVPMLDVFEVTFVRRTDKFQFQEVSSVHSPRNLSDRVGLMSRAFYS